jgi:hypothetical protein
MQRQKKVLEEKIRAKKLKNEEAGLRIDQKQAQILEMIKRYISIRKLIRRNLNEAIENDQEIKKYFIPMIFIKSNNFILTQDANK